MKEPVDHILRPQLPWRSEGAPSQEAPVNNALAELEARLSAKRQQLCEYIASIDPTTSEISHYALAIAEGRLLQLDLDISAVQYAALIAKGGER